MAQIELLAVESTSRELRTWYKAAERECREYGEHGESVEVISGKVRCFNCQGEL